LYADFKTNPEQLNALKNAVGKIDGYTSMTGIEINFNLKA
jgi:hypothetical protein